MWYLYAVLVAAGLLLLAGTVIERYRHKRSRRRIPQRERERFNGIRGGSSVAESVPERSTITAVGDVHGQREALLRELSAYPRWHSTNEPALSEPVPRQPIPSDLALWDTIRLDPVPPAASWAGSSRPPDRDRPHGRRI